MPSHVLQDRRGGGWQGGRGLGRESGGIDTTIESDSGAAAAGRESRANERFRLGDDHARLAVCKLEAGAIPCDQICMVQELAMAFVRVGTSHCLASNCPS